MRAKGVLIWYFYLFNSYFWFFQIYLYLEQFYGAYFWLAFFFVVIVKKGLTFLITYIYWDKWFVSWELYNTIYKTPVKYRFEIAKNKQLDQYVYSEYTPKELKQRNRLIKKIRDRRIEKLERIGNFLSKDYGHILVEYPIFICKYNIRRCWWNYKIKL